MMVLSGQARSIPLLILALMQAISILLLLLPMIYILQECLMLKPESREM